MTPFVAIYENNRLIKVFEKGAEPDELIKIIGGK
jgi:hypothetical protein